MNDSSSAPVRSVLESLLGDSAALAVLTDRKPTVTEQTQAAYNALFAASHPLPPSLLHTIAAVVAAQQGSSALLRWHLTQVDDRELFDDLVSGAKPADPLLAALMEYVDTVSVSPALAAVEDQRTLESAGADPDLVVLIGQLVAFESYLVRLVAGLSALDASPATGAPDGAAAETPTALPDLARTPHSRGRTGDRSALTTTGRSRPTAFTREFLDWEPWLPAPAEDELTAEQIESFASKATTGSVYFRLIARTPGVTLARSTLDNAVFTSKEGLEKGERELAAAVSSKVNDCVYCASVHARKAVQRTRRDEDVDRMLAVELDRDADWVASDVTALATGQDDRWTVLIETAARLAALVPAFTVEDAERLRGIGLTDLEMVDHIASTAFFGWANRLMLTLGEPYWPETEESS
ncbi:peroxidase-related enzyme [Brevibacterium jeotgali]|uniref:Alkylhydroperoxidase domain protein, Avi_7169 family n=1 Tax=Brevibacterium jeotgali TaxID=1262550 RepID=A0A2H1L675_9MICO|nr:peroxidase-related enzyme [Brevibacterium jeotgali]TWB98919.1 alkylhydroperoxidase domain protein [Brevibacterium jeotgali]SMY12250.1 alkylhydroperoxidase domain protein, Avi_7169 family [Brevibacterium jeotgali]